MSHRCHSGGSACCAAGEAVSESRMSSEAASESSLPQYGLHKSD